jgi:acid phosphatase family membrane protein YuiD
MLDFIRERAFVVAILAGLLAQSIKVVTFLIVEKSVNYRRFVQSDGIPNLHATAFSALAVAVGMNAGFDSLIFAFSVCLASIILVDTMNVKNAASRQAEAVWLLMDHLRRDKTGMSAGNRGNSYTPVDVSLGVFLGIVFALLLY